MFSLAGGLCTPFSSQVSYFWGHITHLHPFSNCYSPVPPSILSPCPHSFATSCIFSATSPTLHPFSNRQPSLNLVSLLYAHFVSLYAHCVSLHPIFEQGLAFLGPHHPPAPIFKPPGPPSTLSSALTLTLKLHDPVFESHLAYLVPHHPPTPNCQPPSTLSPHVTSTLSKTRRPVFKLQPAFSVPRHPPGKTTRINMGPNDASVSSDFFSIMFIATN